MKIINKIDNNSKNKNLKNQKFDFHLFQNISFQLISNILNIFGLHISIKLLRTINITPEHVQDNIYVLQLDLKLHNLYKKHA